MPRRLEDLTKQSTQGIARHGKTDRGLDGRARGGALRPVGRNDKARQFFTDLHKNDIKLLGGNSVVVQEVSNRSPWA